MGKVVGNWGEVFKLHLAKQNMTPYKVWKLSGLPKNSVYNILSGKIDPPVSRFEIITKILKIKL